MYKKRVRITSALIAITIILITLISSIFIIDNADHDCSDENCTVCSYLHKAENLLNPLNAGETKANLSVGILLIVVMTLFISYTFLFCSDSPVSSRVKKNE